MTTMAVEGDETRMTAPGLTGYNDQVVGPEGGGQSEAKKRVPSR